MNEILAGVVTVIGFFGLIFVGTWVFGLVLAPTVDFLVGALDVILGRRK